MSAWCLYCCDSGTGALAELNAEQINLIWPYIDAEVWQKRLKDYPADTELSKFILKEAGL
jgi:hypothetical protein